MVSNSYRKYRTTNKNFESSEKKSKFFFPLYSFQIMIHFCYIKELCLTDTFKGTQNEL